jgi:hypothetical protein
MIENYSWVPLSIRNGEREPFTLSDTIPESVKSIINKNIDNLLRDISPNFDFFFAQMRISPGLKSHSIQTFYSYMRSSEEAYLDGLDYILHSAMDESIRSLHSYESDILRKLINMKEILRRANVNWDILMTSDKTIVYLERRVMPEVQERYDIVAESVPELAGSHLRNSWKNAYMHGGSYKEAWEYARKAVECMLTPIVSPNNRRATISSLIRDLAAKPEKWVCTIPSDSNEESVGKFISLVKMMPYEPGHHGQEPTEISEKEAQLQATIAITICQILHDGGLVLKSEEEQSE